MYPIRTFVNPIWRWQPWSGHHCPISRTQYDQITMSMTRAQMTSLVGSEGQVISQSTSSVESFGYNGNTSSYAIVQITLSPGNVTAKFEIGL